jgi:hypothetical protein
LGAFWFVPLRYASAAISPRQRRDRKINVPASGLKTRRVEAKISRKTAADACGISQFKLDRIERGVDVDDDVRKAYDTGRAKLLAEAAKNASTTNGTKPPVKKTAAKKTTARTRKAAQPMSNRGYGGVPQVD